MKEAMKMALEALISYGKSPYIKQSHPNRWANGNKAIKALEEALAEQHLQDLHDENVRLGLYEHGELVGTVGELFDDRIIWKRELDRDLLVYTATQQRTWVGLTDEEIQDAGRFSYCRGGTSEKLYHIMWNSQPSACIGWSREELIAFTKAIEAKLKQKNTSEAKLKESDI